ncbi:MAG: TadE/TadG family type IV pilus assembly protein [Ilumatobacter sp.]|uniref:TadE/TadG family type IV pilus assembly protein n=1 Tax=Ilumatobacter sp. TaxID=1967498 RepID=UPI00329720C6
MTRDRRADRPAERHRSSDDAGQAAVEFAVALPLIVVAMLAIAQVGVSIRHEIAVELAAREGARAAAVSADSAGSASAAARRAVALPMEVTVSSDGNAVSVTVTYVDPTDIAIIGAAIGPVTHTATATMAIEPP